MRRREFIGIVAGSLASLAAAAQPGVKLGYDTYSLRAWKWKALEHLDYAAKLKLDAIQISSLDDFESLETSHLARIRERAVELGIQIDAGIGCICPISQGWKPQNGTPADYILKGLKVAKATGALSMRCFMAGVADRRGKTPIEAHMEKTIQVLRSVRARALDEGVRIAVENHGDLQARELRTLIEEAGRDFVAACLDTGNPVSVMEDPLVTLEILAPYTVTTHIRDSIVFEHPRGAAIQWVALGDGVVNFQQFVSRFRRLCPDAAVQLENITGRPPAILPYLEPGFWSAFPNANAAEFARFLALAKRGRPHMQTMIVADTPGPHPPEYTAALRQQQRVDLERGFAFARTRLGLGLKKN